MADTKEETTVDNSGTRVEDEAGRKRSTDGSFEGFQLFYEKNRNLVNYTGIGLLVLILGFSYYKLFYLPEQEVLAANEMYHAQRIFEQDSFRVALTGGIMVMSPDGQKQMMGFEQVAEEFSGTPSGNLAHFYAGICLLRTGQFDMAIEHLGEYDGSDEVLAPIAVGAIGDSYMELNRAEEAVKYYMKAAEKSENSFTSPYFLKKAAFTQELTKDFAASASSYERIKREFPGSTEGRDIERDIARVKALGNLD